MFFLTRSGIGLYDGGTLRLLSREALYETMSMRAGNADELATACISGHVYYLALCVRGQESDVPSENNTVVEYDTERETFMIRRGVRVKDFFALDGEVYYTNAASPYEVMRYNDPGSGGYGGQAMEALWETAWLDLGKGCMKRDFVLRFTAEADEENLPLELTLTTERREKTRTVLLHRDRRDYRVRIQLSGQRVRLRLSSHARAAGWRIYGGMRVEFTMDEL